MRLYSFLTQSDSIVNMVSKSFTFQLLETTHLIDFLDSSKWPHIFKEKLNKEGSYFNEIFLNSCSLLKVFEKNMFGHPIYYGESLWLGKGLIVHFFILHCSNISNFIDFLGTVASVTKFCIQLIFSSHVKEKLSAIKIEGWRKTIS